MEKKSMTASATENLERFLVNAQGHFVATDVIRGQLELKYSTFRNALFALRKKHGMRVQSVRVALHAKEPLTEMVRLGDFYNVAMCESTARELSSLKEKAERMEKARYGVVRRASVTSGTQSLAKFDREESVAASAARGSKWTTLIKAFKNLLS